MQVIFACINFVKFDFHTIRIYMISEFALIAAIAIFFNSRNLKKSENLTPESDTTGVLNLKTEFYDSTGKVVLIGPMKIWYKDSTVIEEVVRISIVTDTAGKTSVSYSPIAYKYIDLIKNSWYDYKSFDDTARIITSGVLPDSFFLGSGGWTFYANNVRMKGQPEVMPDTMIGTIKYMRIKFSRLDNGALKSYVIGYLRCDNKGKMFSLEKNFSHTVRCTMTKVFEFKEGASRPFASRELEFLSDTLSMNERRVFDAWKENAKKVKSY